MELTLASYASSVNWLIFGLGSDDESAVFNGGDYQVGPHSIGVQTSASTASPFDGQTVGGVQMWNFGHSTTSFERGASAGQKYLLERNVDGYLSVSMDGKSMWTTTFTAMGSMFLYVGGTGGHGWSITGMKLTETKDTAVSGVYKINPGGLGEFDVYCDFDRADGPWTTFQRRLDGSVDFFRTYSEYQSGFGLSSGEHWLGLDRMNQLTEMGGMQLRIDLCDKDKGCKIMKYNNFNIGPASDGYRLTVSDVDKSSTLTSLEPSQGLIYHSGSKFTTKDKDQDSNPANCATVYSGAWWYNSCHYVNLNGIYNQGGVNGMSFLYHEYISSQMSMSRKTDAKKKIAETEKSCPTSHPIKIGDWCESRRIHCNIAVKVTAANSKPVVPALQTRTVAEESPVGTRVGLPLIVEDQDVDAGGQSIQWSVTACLPFETNTCPLRVDGCTGSITVIDSDALDFETVPSFVVTVVATDDGSPPLSSDPAEVTITLINANDPPSIAAQSFTVNENVAIGSIVGTIVATDPDQLGATLSFIDSTTLPTPFAVNADGTIVTTSIPNFEGSTSDVSLRVSVRDSSGATDGPVLIRILTNDQNDPPVVLGFDDVDDVLLISEKCVPGSDAAVDSTCVQTLEARDDDDVHGATNEGSPLVWSMVGAPSGSSTEETSNACNANLFSLSTAGELRTSASSTMSTWREDTSVGVGKAWHDVTSSSNGEKLVAVVRNGNMWRSTDSGVNWIEIMSTGAAKNWWSITSSSDGTKLAAVVYLGNIWTSINSGVTWTPDTSVSAKKWMGVTLSSDGAKAVAVVENGNIFRFTESGWGSPLENQASTLGGTVAGTNEAVARATCVADINCKGVGFKFADGGTGGGATGTYYTFTTGGTGPFTNWRTWLYTRGVQTISVGGTKNWHGITSSSDGTKIFATVKFGNIWRSIDSGTSWTEDASVGATKRWQDITSSSDGTKLAAVVYGGYIYTSINSGETWIKDTSVGTIKTWFSITSSSDGSLLAATVLSVAATSNIFKSNDAGANWVEDTSPCSAKNWQGITSSSDGKKLITVVDAGNIWVSSAATTVTLDCDGKEVTPLTTVTLDYETIQSCFVWLVVTDKAGIASATPRRVKIKVLNVNEAPTLSTTPSTCTVPEDTPVGTVLSTCNVTIADPDTLDTPKQSVTVFQTQVAKGLKYDYDGTKKLIVIGPGLNFETDPTVSLRLLLRDDGAPNSVVEIVLVVQISDVNEMPQFTNLDAARSVSEDATPGTTITPSLAATDPDAGDTLIFTLVTSTNDVEVSSSDGALAVPASGSGLDYETSPLLSLTVRVVDSSSLQIEGVFDLSVTDANDAPTLNQVTPSVKIAVGPPIGSNVGTIWTASDQDAGHGETLQFRAEDDTTGNNVWRYFSLDAVTGQTTIADAAGSAAMVDAAVFTLRARAEDTGGMFSEYGTMTVTVVNGLSIPILVDPQAYTIAESAVGGASISTSLQCTDTDVPDRYYYLIFIFIFASQF